METIQRLTPESENKWRRIYEYFYFFVFGCVLLVDYQQITMFCGVVRVVSIVNVVGIVTDMLLPVLLMINVWFLAMSLLGKAPAPFAFSKKEALVALVCCGVLLIPHILYGYDEPFWFAIFILGARGIEQKKLLRFYFIVSVIICSLTFLCGCTGVIENLVYHRGDGTSRMAFGFNYPTDFCSHIFFLVVCWLWLREEKTSWLEVVGIAALSVFAYLACHARTTAAMLMLLALWMTVAKLKARKTDGHYTMWKPLQACCLLAAPLATAFMVTASVFYDAENRFLSLVDKFTNCRLSQGHIGFVRYDFTLFGQAVEMHGNGGTTEVRQDYFFLDCTYVNTLLRYGILALCVLLFLVVTLVLAEKRKKAFVHVGLLGIVALQCVIEQHLMELGHSPLLLLLLTYDGNGQSVLDFLHVALKKPQKAETP